MKDSIKQSYISHETLSSVSCCWYLWIATQWARSQQECDSPCLANQSDSYQMQSANSCCLFATFLLPRNSHLRLSTHTQSVYAERRVHDRIIMDDVLAGFTWIVKYKGSTDADYTSKSNAFKISVLLTASDQTPEFRKNHQQSLQRPRFSGHVKVFQAHTRGQYML
jgi:hypothetical protein